MGPLIGILTFSALLISCVLIVASFPLNRRIANWLAVGILVWSQVVLGSILLSELHAISLAGFALWHLLLLAISVVIWTRRGRPGMDSLSPPSIRSLASFARRNIPLTGLIAVIAGIQVFLVLPTSFVESDGAHYHIPRAHYWIQNGSARHFYTDDIRQVERPPNSSFLYMWQILATGSYRGLNAPQWIAAFGTALAIAAISRSGGHSWEASALAATVYLSLPAVVLQMSAPWNDLLTGFGIASFGYLVIEGILLRHSPANTASDRYFAYAGLAFGLMVGTKFTSLLLIPALAILLLILTIAHFREAIRPLLSLAAFCAAGFLLLGSYNYVLNVAEFGRPIESYDVPLLVPEGTSKIDDPSSSPVAPAPTGESQNSPGLLPNTSSAAHDLGISSNTRALIIGASFAPSPAHDQPTSTEDLRRSSAAPAQITDLVRHVYQVMDWIIMKPIPGADTLYAINNAAYRFLDEQLGLDLESHPQFNLSDFGMRPIKSGEIGFGPLGYAMLLSAPIALAAIILRRSSRSDSLVSLGALLLGLGAFITHPLVASWFETLTRYHAGAFALMTAALIPFAYSRRPIGLIWLLPISFLTIWSAYQTAVTVRELDRQNRPLASWQAAILDSGLPADARFGVMGRVEYVHLLEEFPGYRFLPVARDDIVPALIRGDLDAALVLDPDDAFQRYRLPLEHDQSLLVEYGKPILVANLEPYGASLEVSGGVPELHLKSSGLIRRLGPDLVQVFLPTIGPAELGVPLAMEIEFPVEVPGGETLSMYCGGSLLNSSVDGPVMTIDVPQSAIDLSQPSQLCRLRIRDQEFGGRIPSPTIELKLSPAVP